MAGQSEDDDIVEGVVPRLKLRRQALRYGLAMLLTGVLSVGIVVAGSNLSMMASAEIARTEWQVDIAHPGDVRFNDIIESSDGNLILAGVRGDAGWVLKTDALGHLTWERIFSATNGTVKLFSLADDAAGGCVAAGYWWDYGKASIAAWLVHLNGNGTTLWNQTYYFETAESIISCDDGGFIMSGEVDAAALTDLWIMRIDSDGVQVWNRTLSFTAHTYEAVLVKCTNGDAALVTNLWTAESDTEVWMSRFNATNGQSRWNRRYGGGPGTDSDFIHDAIACRKGGFLLVGETWSLAASFSDFWLLRLDEDGDTLWNRACGERLGDEGRAVVEANDSQGFLVAGASDPSLFAFLNSRTVVYRLDPDGNVVWGRTYSVDGSMRPWCALAERKNSGFILAGSGSDGGVLIAWLRGIADIPTPLSPGSYLVVSGACGSLAILGLLSALLVVYAQRPRRLAVLHATNEDFELIPGAISQLSTGSRPLARIKSARSNGDFLLTGQAMGIWLRARVSHKSNALLLCFRLGKALLMVAVVAAVVAGAYWSTWLLGRIVTHGTIDPLYGLLLAAVFAGLIAAGMLTRQSMLLRTFPQALANTLEWVRASNSGGPPSHIEFRAYRVLYAGLSVLLLLSGALFLLFGWVMLFYEFTPDFWNSFMFAMMWPLLLFVVVWVVVSFSLAGVLLYRARPMLMSVSLTGVVLNRVKLDWAEVKLDYDSPRGRVITVSSMVSGAPVAFRFKEWHCFGGSIFLDWVEWFRKSSEKG